MIGQKLNRQNLTRMLNNARHGLSRGYHHAKNILGNIDQGVAVAKQLYATFEPLIAAVVGSHHHQALNNNVMHGLSQYETIRNTVVDVDHHVGKLAVAGQKAQGLLGLN